MMDHQNFGIRAAFPAPEEPTRQILRMRRSLYYVRQRDLIAEYPSGSGPPTKSNRTRSSEIRSLDHDVPAIAVPGAPLERHERSRSVTSAPLIFHPIVQAPLLRMNGRLLQPHRVTQCVMITCNLATTLLKLAAEDLSLGLIILDSPPTSPQARMHKSRCASFARLSELRVEGHTSINGSRRALVAADRRSVNSARIREIRIIRGCFAPRLPGHRSLARRAVIRLPVNGVQRFNALTI